MLRPTSYSKPYKQRLFLDTQPVKFNGLCSSMNVKPITACTVQKQNSFHLRTDISEIKPQRQSSTAQLKQSTASLTKNYPKFSEERNRAKSNFRTKTENFKITEKKETVQKIINSFLKTLGENNLFHVKPGEMLHLKSETLKNICYYFMHCLLPKNAANFNNLANLNKQKNIQQFIANNPNDKPAHNNRKLKLVSAKVSILIKSKELTKNNESLASQAAYLKNSVDNLLRHKAQLQDELKVTMHQVNQLKRFYQQAKVNVQNYTAESEQIEVKIKQDRNFLAKLDELTTSIREFALSTSNAQVKQSAQNYKNLQSEMFKLTELVSHTAFGKKDFQKSITIWDIEKRTQNELKMFNKFLIQNTHSTYQQKCKELKDFLTKFNNQYAKIYEELVHVIQQKTKYIKSFAEYVELWEQKYLEKTEYLGNLSTNFAFHCQKIDEIRQILANGEHKQESSSLYNQIILQVQDIIHLFKLGNYFY